MRKFEKHNQPEEEVQLDKIEAVLESDPFSPDNNLKDIKNEAENQGEVLINESSDKLNKNFESFSEIVGDDVEPRSELEIIKSVTESDISAQKNIFQSEIETLIPKVDNSNISLENSLDEKQNERLDNTEVVLGSIKDAYSKINEYEKQLKMRFNKDVGSQELLKNMLAESKSVLESAEAEYKSILSARVKESFKTKSEMTPIKALDEIIMPGLSVLEKEKASVLPPKDFSIFKKGIEAINFYMPQGKVARTLTVAGIMTIASLALSSAPSVGLAVYLGCKLGRSLAGSYIGEKVSEVVEKKMDKKAEKKKEEDIEKIDFTKEDINNSVNKLIELGGTNLKSQKNQAMLKNFAKIGTHIVVAGVTVAGLELAELGMHSFLSSGVEAGSSKIASASIKTLAAESFFACSRDAGQDLVEDKVTDKATTNNRYKRIMENHAKIMREKGLA